MNVNKELIKVANYLENIEIDIEMMENICSCCAKKMKKCGCIKISGSYFASLIRNGAWDKLPKGWTQESLESFWKTLTGRNKHKVTACIEKMKDKIDNPGAFCASLADKIEGPEWRKGEK